MKPYTHLLLTVLLCSCATYAPQSPKSISDNPKPSWPAHPEQTRIIHTTSFSSPLDLNIRKGFLQSITDLFLGAEKQQLSRPYGVSVYKQTIAVADPDMSAVHVYDLLSHTYNQIKSVGDTNLLSPISLALDDEHLYIADSKLQKVFIVKRDSKSFTTISNFKRPTSLALDPIKQHLYVSDTIDHNIKIFSTNGDLIRIIGNRGDEEGEFNYPSHITLNDKLLVVNDTMNFRIKIFNKEGAHQSTFGKQGDASGYLTQSKGVAIDSDGNIYVADALANRIQIFSQSGDFLLEFGQTGNKPGEFSMPTGLAIWDDRIYVADSYNQRIQVFQYLKTEQ